MARARDGSRAELEQQATDAASAEVEPHHVLGRDRRGHSADLQYQGLRWPSAYGRAQRATGPGTPRVSRNVRGVRTGTGTRFPWCPRLRIPGPRQRRMKKFDDVSTEIFKRKLDSRSKTVRCGPADSWSPELKAVSKQLASWVPCVASRLARQGRALRWPTRASGSSS